MGAVNPRYFLRPDVFLCTTRHFCVVLDVAKDRYLCVDRESFDSLAPWLWGWSKHSSNPATPDEPSELVKSLALELIEKEVLTDRVPEGYIDPFETHTTAIREIGTRREPFKIRCLPCVPRFYFSSLVASYYLKRRTFQDAVRRIRQYAGRTLDCSNSDLQFVEALIARFNALRLSYPRPYLCMFDCLALLEFLSGYAVYPRWVFGVRTDPFFAHCWLQLGDAVLNDRVSRITAYTPIMQV